MDETQLPTLLWTEIVNCEGYMTSDTTTETLNHFLFTCSGWKLQRLAPCNQDRCFEPCPLYPRNRQQHLARVPRPPLLNKYQDAKLDKSSFERDNEVG